jgi:Trk K+ transport system NAD-binding subunit
MSSPSLPTSSASSAFVAAAAEEIADKELRDTKAKQDNDTQVVKGERSHELIRVPNAVTTSSIRSQMPPLEYTLD